jgi:ectoine hydroxylase-related dioxygenase (phytanoyl-CoA dioxygenase family)
MTLSLPQLDFYRQNGYLVVHNIITPELVEEYRRLYDRFLDGSISTGANRSDLGAGLGQSPTGENITQIMWPSDFAPEVRDMPYHQNALAIARQLLGDDIEMDFDMLINKAPHTNTPTPWHQDAAYWVDMPDKRAASCWMALDPATIDNGCMWYVPGSQHQPIRPHRFAGAPGGALMCDASESEGLAIEIPPGSCIWHDGGTLHYSRGNQTDAQRRAFIVNYRPAAMIALERSMGFDHGRSGGAADRKVRS